MCTSLRDDNLISTFVVTNFEKKKKKEKKPKKKKKMGSIKRRSNVLNYTL